MAGAAGVKQETEQHFPSTLYELKNQLSLAPSLDMDAREKLIWGHGMNVRLKNLRCATATICGGRSGSFSWPTTPLAASREV